MPLLNYLPTPLAALLDPWLFLADALSFLPGTLLTALLTLDHQTLLSWPRLRSAWFSRFWAHAAPQVRANAESKVIPLLQGRVTRGHILLPASSPNDANPPNGGGPNPHPGVSGTVLEIGPGSGTWASLFARATLPSVRKVYGVEPNSGVHHLLRERIRATPGLQDRYEIVPLGIEEMGGSSSAAATTIGVAREGVDCIVTIMCLCSIPEPRRNIAALYGFLKPGGRWYVYEHVRCFEKQGWGMRMYQAFLNLLWPHFIGGCEMTRDTARWLTEAGPWSEIDLFPLAGEPWYFTMPHIIGVLTK
ncbi:hypothetical protein VTK56DRAFT_6578 [Thermocarpiscus australiensis]